jgi:hypothetical protein
MSRSARLQRELARRKAAADELGMSASELERELARRSDEDARLRRLLADSEAARCFPRRVCRVPCRVSRAMLYVP